MACPDLTQQHLTREDQLVPKISWCQAGTASSAMVVSHLSTLIRLELVVHAEQKDGLDTEVV